VSQTIYGGNASSYTIVVPYDSFAEIGKGPAIQVALGEAGYQRVLAKTKGIVTHIDRIVSRFVPDLSFGPEPPSK